jgi:hypothetical protein
VERGERKYSEVNEQLREIVSTRMQISSALFCEFAKTEMGESSGNTRLPTTVLVSPANLKIDRGIKQAHPSPFTS